MPDYQTVLSDASRLSTEEQLRLIDELSSLVPADRPPTLPEGWVDVIQRRSAEIDAGTVITEDWAAVRDRLFAKHGVRNAN